MCSDNEKQHPDPNYLLIKAQIDGIKTELKTLDEWYLFGDYDYDVLLRRADLDADDEAKTWEQKLEIYQIAYLRALEMLYNHTTEVRKQQYPECQGEDEEVEYLPEQNPDTDLEELPF